MSSSEFMSVIDVCINVLNMHFTIFGYSVNIMAFVAFGVIASFLTKVFYDYFS